MRHATARHRERGQESREGNLEERRENELTLWLDQSIQLDRSVRLALGDRSAACLEDGECSGPHDIVIGVSGDNVVSLNVKVNPIAVSGGRGVGLVRHGVSLTDGFFACAHHLTTLRRVERKHE